MDQDEEEEDADEDEEDDDEDGDPFNRERKKLFGETKLYCPVMLKERNVLWPGTVECAAKYRERTYFFSAVEARTKFLEDPESYLSADTPVEVRLVLNTLGSLWYFLYHREPMFTLADREFWSRCSWFRYS